MEKVRETKKHGRQRSANGVVVNYSWEHVWQLLTAVYNDKNITCSFSPAVAVPFSIIH
jgi:hypothetical protein